MANVTINPAILNRMGDNQPWGMSPTDGSYGVKYFGFAKERKPQDATAGDKLFEIDTGKTWVYDGSFWIVSELPSRVERQLASLTSLVVDLLERQLTVLDGIREQLQELR